MSPGSIDCTEDAETTHWAAYFDDSGHPNDQEVVVVAGFIATERNWLLFERDWRDILDKEGIASFHMTDFEKSRQWPHGRKDNILIRLVEIIRTRTIKSISQAVLMNDYRRINEKWAFEETVGTPYALVGRTVAKSLNDWKKDFAKPQDKLLVFFEDGTKHKGDFIDAMQRDQLRCPTFTSKAQSMPLQAADLLAWEVFNAFKAGEVRPSLDTLIGSLSPESRDHGLFGFDALKRICEHKDATVPLRTELPAGTTIVHHSSPKKPRKRTIR